MNPEPPTDRREFSFQIADLATRSGITVEEAVATVERYCKQGILRKIGPDHFEWVTNFETNQRRKKNQ